MDGSYVVCRHSNNDCYVAHYQRRFEAEGPIGSSKLCKPSYVQHM